MSNGGAQVSPSKLAPGARVVVRDEEWLVRRVDALAGEGYAVHVTGMSELVRNHDSIFLTTLDSVENMLPEKTALVPDDSPMYRRSRLYVESLLRRTPPTDNRIYLGHRAVMDPKRYQLRPAQMALGSLRQRILIADGVGLGKTLEVGVLLSELIKRGRGDRILVVVLKSLLEQFQKELWSRFAIPLVRLDSVGIQRVRNKIPANRNPFSYYNRAIISVDTLKDDGRYRHYLEQCRWDAVVIDECHNVANEGTLRNLLAERLAETCDSLILTSATPHNGRPRSFANLMNMLSPTSIADPDDYEVEDIKGLYARRFKKDVAAEVEEDFRDRDLELIRLLASEREEAFLSRLHGLRFRTLDRGSGKDALYRTTVFKAFLSSPAACIETLSNRIQRIDENLANETGKEDLIQDRAVLQELLERADAVEELAFSKYQRLVVELEALGYGERGTDADRVIIFAERIRTLEWLSERLRERFALGEDSVRIFHAGLPDVDQQAIVESFGKQDSDIRILLASDVASEGVNLHFFCHRMFHFDVPWSPIKLEQRNGRIDRFGQRHIPVIRYLLTTSEDEEIKGDTRIIERLVEKEEYAYKNIGDAAVLMGLYSAAQEEEAVARTIGRNIAPEKIVPDAPPEIDFLKLLEAGAADGGKEETTAAPVSLYNSDYTFADAAFNEVAPELPDGTELERDPSTQSFRFYAPPDLTLRLEFLPREALPADRYLDLSADRARVIEAIEASRREEAKWPAVHLLWELHPAVQWLTDKVLARYHRHEAPLIVTSRLGTDEVIFLFQGLLSNRAGRPVVAEWFGIPLRNGERVDEVVPLDEVLARSGFCSELPNPGGSGVSTEYLAGQLPAVVKAARKHLLTRRVQRGRDLADALRDHLRRLERWKDRSLSEVGKREAALNERGQLGPSHRHQLERRRHDVERLWADTERWVKMSLTTDENPYVRVVAVFVSLDQRK